ncbi:hypothetical protein [Sphingomonas mesophila]|uniref:hypothetical protein n=1 Tax=Sphingomonas mesophila TaxID=2303576 RepID=UPI0013C35266|nr:hypothetical protein [Sphingomonas mesophila]
MLSAIAFATLTACGVPNANENSSSEVAIRRETPRQAAKPNEPYALQLAASPVGADKVEFNITTNAPLPVEVMADVTLAGLRDDETWIGAQERITLSQPTTVFVLDATQNGKMLPAGNYLAEVSYHKRWGADKNPAAREVPDLNANQVIKLGGSGETASHARNTAALQRWVMGEMDYGRRWSDGDLRAKLGNFERYESPNAVNSVIYYFPDADLSLFVDPRRGKVFTFKLGRVS